MKHLAIALAVAMIAGCAATAERKPSEEDQAIIDYITMHELEELNSLRSGRTDDWSVITPKYIVYEGRNQSFYLVKFKRNCHELLDDTNVVADVRWDSNTLRARFDTIRGCHVDSIYALTEAEADELTGVGTSFNRRN
ncbi:MAG: DUF6491 family protein [Pseudomonadota bacterium]